MKLFRDLRPLQRASAARDVLAGIVLATMDIPQVLGYAKIAGMFCSDRVFIRCCCHWWRLQLSARRDTWLWRQTRRRLQSLLVECRVMKPSAEVEYAALAGVVALLTAGIFAAGATPPVGVYR